MVDLPHELSKLYKQHYGSLLTSLLYAYRSIDIATAEDIVQDAFSAALLSWKPDKLPENARAWLYRVCCNKALNLLKKEQRPKPPATAEPSVLTEMETAGPLPDDHQLRMLFACAHPDLAPKVQVALTLKYVANLKVEAIATALALTLDGTDKLLLRARQKIRNEKLLLATPGEAAVRSRLPAVHKVIYLMFNEGYKASWGNDVLREDLCEEALILNKLLLDSPFAGKETAALQALMLFNAARFASRFGPSGELMDLERQNRGLWNKELIALGAEYLHSSRAESISSYHLEASIACLHCSASTFEETDWETIVSLYSRLLDLQPNPFVELNYSIALYYAGRRKQAFQLLHALEKNQFFARYYLLNAALGKLYGLEGGAAKALDYLKKASTQAKSPKEREFIENMKSRFGGFSQPVNGNGYDLT